MKIFEQCLKNLIFLQKSPLAQIPERKIAVPGRKKTLVRNHTNLTKMPRVRHKLADGSTVILIGGTSDLFKSKGNSYSRER